MKTAQLPKFKRPETVGDAKTWGMLKSRYLRLGLCHVCAAQAAYGHQVGWGDINPPCDDCKLIVPGFPSPTKEGSPWRKHVGAVDGPAQDAPEADRLRAQTAEQAPGVP